MTDEYSWDLSRKLWQTAIESYPQTYVMAFSAAELRASSLSKLLSFILDADVSLFVAREFSFLWEEFSLSKNLNTRWAGLIGIRPDQFTRMVDVDSESLRHNTQKLHDVLRLGKRLTIETDSDHSLSFEIDHSACFADSGLVQNSGDIGCIPGGRVLIKPREQTASGDLLINGSLSSVGILQEPVRFLIRSGRLKKIYAKSDISDFRASLRSRNKNRRILVRVGIGLNPHGKITGNCFVDERTHGVIHLAFGDEIDFRSHILNPTLSVATLKRASVKIDNKVILRRGKLVV
ncbi:MAG: hypothetical protein GXO76_13640 [Calditrichaeota bacterium]|nr:hypothetical protein [Calditrichota bacterium]